MTTLIRLATAIFILLALSIGFWVFVNIYPFKPVEFARSYLPVENKIVRPGEVLRIKYEFKKYTNSPATVSRAFINSIVYTLPVTQTPRECGVYSYVGLSVSIPTELPPGVYFLRQTYTYDIPYSSRSVSITIDTEKFEVLPKA